MNKNQPNLFVEMENIDTASDLPDVDNKKMKQPEKAINKALDLYLFQISKHNIIRYFNYGMLLPVKYININGDDRTEKDIQNDYPDYLVLTKDKYINNKDGQYFIEVVLSKNEVKELVKTSNKDVFLYDKPIPISRVFKIYYNDEKDIQDTLNTVKVGKDSYICNSYEIINNNIEKIDSIDEIEFRSVDIDYNDKINYFDKIMGMFAFMKNSSLYYGHCANYSDNYFKALSVINNELKDQIKINKSDNHFHLFKSIIDINDNNKNSNGLFKKIVSIIHDKNSDFNLETLKSITKEFEDEFIKDELKGLKQEIDTAKNILAKPIKQYEDSPGANKIIVTMLKAIAMIINNMKEQKSKSDTEETKTLEKLLKIATNSLNKNDRFDLLIDNTKLKNYYYAAYIAQYGDKLSDDKINLKNTITKEVPEEYAEIVLALMGIYFGYFRLLPQEEIKIKSIYKDVIHNPVNIKFKLDSILDYVTVESIYQFTFNNTNNENCDFLLLDEINSSGIDINLPKFKDDDQYVLSIEDYFGKQCFTIETKDLSIRGD